MGVLLNDFMSVYLCDPQRRNHLLLSLLPATIYNTKIYLQGFFLHGHFLSSE
jgi:hypothetical protein